MRAQPVSFAPATTSVPGDRSTHPGRFGPSWSEWDDQVRVVFRDFGEVAIRRLVGGGCWSPVVTSRLGRLAWSGRCWVWVGAGFRVFAEVVGQWVGEVWGTDGAGTERGGTVRRGTVG